MRAPSGPSTSSTSSPGGARRNSGGATAMDSGSSGSTPNSTRQARAMSAISRATGPGWSSAADSAIPPRQEIAWLWLRHQPNSALTQWFRRRTAGESKRMRCVMIVALARKLAIALWRYVELGLIPEGATLSAR